MNVPLVSVTVPVYNTSKYLVKCLESLRTQTLKEIEFILVDDGSTDDSGRICDEYVRNDSRFRVIHQKNGGLSVARQTGLEQARGKYVIVCDSDDWVEPDMYESLYSAAAETGADIVLCGYYAQYDDLRSIPTQTVFEEEKGCVDVFDLMKRGAGSSWVKLVRRSLFECTGARYAPGINLSEDSLILYKLLKGSPRIVQVKAHLYHYRRLFGGKSYTNNVKMVHIHQLRYTYEWLKDNYIGLRYEPLVFQRAIDLAFACLRVKDLDKIYLKEFLRSELPWCRFRSNEKSAKSILVSIEKALPLAIARMILSLLYRFVYK